MSLASQVFYLGRRSLIRILRQPANWIFPLVFPLALMAVIAITARRIVSWQHLR